MDCVLLLGFAMFMEGKKKKQFEAARKLKKEGKKKEERMERGDEGRMEGGEEEKEKKDADIIYRSNHQLECEQGKQQPQSHKGRFKELFRPVHDWFSGQSSTEARPSKLSKTQQKQQRSICKSEEHDSSIDHSPPSVASTINPKSSKTSKSLTRKLKSNKVLSADHNY